MSSIHFTEFIHFTSLLLLCFVFSRQQTPATGLSCNILLNGYCYIYVSTDMTFIDAENNCVSMGGHLTSIHSDAENTAVHSISPTTESIYIGFNDLMSEGNFRWTDSSDFSYTNWRAGEPNDSDNNEDCCYILNSDKWNDIPCTLLQHSICKVSAISLPSTSTSSFFNKDDPYQIGVIILVLLLLSSILANAISILFIIYLLKKNNSAPKNKQNSIIQNPNSDEHIYNYIDLHALPVTDTTSITTINDESRYSEMDSRIDSNTNPTTTSTTTANDDTNDRTGYYNVS